MGPLDQVGVGRPRFVLWRGGCGGTGEGTCRDDPGEVPTPGVVDFVGRVFRLVLWSHPSGPQFQCPGAPVGTDPSRSQSGTRLGYGRSGVRGCTVPSGTVGRETRGWKGPYKIEGWVRTETKVSRPKETKGRVPGPHTRAPSLGIDYGVGDPWTTHTCVLP